MGQKNETATKKPLADVSFLTDMKIAAVKEINSSMPLKHDTHDSYVARCWLVGFETALSSRGLKLELKPK